MTSRDQVERMLTLVPYLRTRDQIPVSQVADEFGVPVKQIIVDLNALWFCGLPGGMPGDLIDIDMDALEGDGVVRLDNADYLPRPPRLRTNEAIALQVALRAIRESAEPEQADVIDALLAKLDSVTHAEAPVAIQIERGDRQTHQTISDAVDDGTRVRIEYAGVHRDEITERTIEPNRMFVAEGHTFVRSWCLASDDWRVFRLDRILRADATGEQAAIRSAGGDLFTIAENASWAELELAPDAWHIADLRGAELLDPGNDDGATSKRVRLPGASLAWLRRLVLSHAGDVRVLGPPELVDDVAMHARRALRQYYSN